MKSVNQLEKERKNVLLDMNLEELNAYFENIVKKQFEYFPKITDEGIVTNFDEKKYNELQETLQDSINILDNHWTNLRAIPLGYIATEWANRFYDSLKEYESLEDNLRYISIVETVKSLERALDSLIDLFNIFHLINFYKMLDFIGVLEIAKVPDKELKRIVETLRDEYSSDNPIYYENRLNLYYNDLIKNAVENVERIIKRFKEYEVEKEYTPEELEEFRTNNPNYEEIIENFERFYDVYKLGWFFVDYYEFLKENPFLEANDVVVKSMLYDMDMPIKNIKEFKEKLKDSGEEKALKELEEIIENVSINLSYDFDNFKIIVPEENSSDNK